MFVLEASITFNETKDNMKFVLYIYSQDKRNTFCIHKRPDNYFYRKADIISQEQVK